MTLRNTIRGVEAAGHVVEVIGPDRFRSIPCPTYPEIRLALRPFPGFAKLAAEFAPDAVHIATEGPVGTAARKFCLREGLAFTTAYHTRFPEYVHARIRLPLALSYQWLRRFHAPATAVMVATAALHTDLERWGFGNLVTWTRGVDTELFRPGPPLANDWTRPVFMYVGRVAVEKNIEAFLALDLPGTKVVVGDGPQRAALQRRFPGTVFTGAKHGEELAAHFRSADAFVFPSRTDTFGLVLLEAMASGTPAAAFPVTGPIDVVASGRSGVLSEDLRAAALAALELSRDAVRQHALAFSWERATAQFLSHLRSNHAGPRFA
jgi:glycosyltransferase involved in cell wall biosynthesis